MFQNQKIWKVQAPLPCMSWKFNNKFPKIAVSVKEFRRNKKHKENLFFYNGH